jgi:hypothetical protein
MPEAMNPTNSTTSHGMDRTLRWISYFGATTQRRARGSAVRAAASPRRENGQCTARSGAQRAAPSQRGRQAGRIPHWTCGWQHAVLPAEQAAQRIPGGRRPRSWRCQTPFANRCRCQRRGRGGRRAPRRRCRQIDAHGPRLTTLTRRAADGGISEAREPVAELQAPAACRWSPSQRARYQGPHWPSAGLQTWPAGHVTPAQRFSVRTMVAVTKFPRLSVVVRVRVHRAFGSSV